MLRKREKSAKVSSINIQEAVRESLLRVCSACDNGRTHKAHSTYEMEDCSYCNGLGHHGLTELGVEVIKASMKELMNPESELFEHAVSPSA